MKTKIVIIILAVIVVVGVGIAAYIANRTHEPQKIEIPSTFDPAALEQQIGPENSVQMTSTEYGENAQPLWDKQNKTLTFPLSFAFRNNRIPTLYIEKTVNIIDSSAAKMITIRGFEQGDIFLSPITGDIELQKGTDKFLSTIVLYFKDPQGEEESIVLATTGLNNLMNFNRPIENNTRCSINIGDPIGSFLTSDKHPMFDGQVQISGHAQLLEKLNLATTPEGKLIVIIE
jgi:hypothetical protein